MEKDLIFALSASIFALFYALLLVIKVRKSPSGTEKMQEISNAIRDGAKAFLNREYRAVSLVGAFIFLILLFTLGLKPACGFLFGAVMSGIAGLIGMMISTRANVKVAQQAQKGIAQALRLAFLGGSVTGFLVVGLGLLAISLFYLLTKDIGALVALGFGASLISVFARLGGGIYTKAADVGADLVGKIEQNIPEDDPRNPAVIADQVGDNVGDCAGMAADVFETYVVTTVAAMILGYLLFQTSKAVFLPLSLGAIAILASIIGSFFVRMGKNKNILGALFKGLIVTSVLSAIGFYFPLKNFATIVSVDFWKLYGSSLAGLVLVWGIFWVTDFFTSKKHWPVLSIAKASQKGHATNIITGLALGMESTVLPVLFIAAAIFVSVYLAGLYGLAIASVSMLSLAGIIIALDSYGPITDNASGIAEMAGLSEEV